MRTIRLGPRPVGPGQPCFIIAEAGVNHNGDPALAARLVDAAAEAGADAVKFQTFRADRLVTRTAPKADYQQSARAPGEEQYAMLRRLELDEPAHAALAERCRARGLLFLSTPFDEGSADLLAGLNVPAYKIGSGDLTNHPLLAHVARKGRPVILSTGMADLEEVRAAVAELRRAGAWEIALLHAVSNYPADPAAANLRAVRTLATVFDVPSGYSDHTPGRDVAVAAVALGACILEKHLTLDRTLDGPDHAASLEPAELAELVRAVRTVESALGDGSKRPHASERAIAAVARRSVVAARPIAAGTALDASDLVLKRPGTGLPPAALPALLGRLAAVAIPEGALLRPEMLA